MKKLARTDSGIDYIKLLAKHSRKTAALKYDSANISEFGAEIQRTLEASVQAEHRVRGLRAEALFLVVVAGLGKVLLIKSEDEGELYYNGDELAVPDFRVVTEENVQLLIEVKCHRAEGHPQRPFKLPDSAVQKLRRYADRTQGSLRVAIFWEHIGWWTLNAIEAFEPGVANVRQWSLSFERAFATNEMTSLGDCTIATPPPFRVRVQLDPSTSDCVGPEDVGTFNLTVRSIRILWRDRELQSVSAELAFRLVWYGNWQEHDQESHYADGRMVGFDFPCAPAGWEDSMPEFQGMVPIGALSEMISRAYLSGADGTIHTASNAEVLTPGQIQTFIPADLSSLQFPVAVLRFVPNFDFGKKVEVDAEVCARVSTVPTAGDLSGEKLPM